MRSRRSRWKDSSPGKYSYLALPMEAIVAWLVFTGHLFVMLGLAYAIVLGLWFVFSA